MADDQTPERIWTWYFIPSKQDDVIKGGWDDVEDRKSAEYVRADIVEALRADLARAVEALEECQRDLDRYSQMEYSSDHPVHVRNRQRDYDGNPARIALASIKERDNG